MKEEILKKYRKKVNDFNDNPRDKKFRLSKCTENFVCTDITGEHHSIFSKRKRF